MASTIQKQLEDRSGLKLKLKINDNRSTMLSVKWEPDLTKVSLHRIFLNAPQNVMDALACYLRREDKTIAPTVRAFIDDKLKTLNYFHEIDQSKLYSQGNVYNLDRIYEQMNHEYFENKLKLYITWFGKPNRRCRSKVTFGLYHDPLKLIKINRLLDSPAFPYYLIAYVVYHEMVHYVCPPCFDVNGQYHIHTKEFKEREALFRHFGLVQDWIKKNKENFFL